MSEEVLSAGKHEADIFQDFASSIQIARANDLQDLANDFIADTYFHKNGLYYWPDGDDGDSFDLPYFMDLSPTEKELVDAFEEEHPYTYLSHGSGRIAFVRDLEPETIVKIGRWGPGNAMGNGVNQNAIEINFYESLKTETDALLPIFDSGEENNWLIQPKVQTYKECDSETRPEFQTVVDMIRERLGLVSELIYDDNEDNIGRWNGKWYFIDYARVM